MIHTQTIEHYIDRPRDMSNKSELVLMHKQKIGPIDSGYRNSASDARQNPRPRPPSTFLPVESLMGTGRRGGKLCCWGCSECDPQIRVPVGAYIPTGGKRMLQRAVSGKSKRKIQRWPVAFTIQVAGPRLSTSSTKAATTSPVQVPRSPIFRVLVRLLGHRLQSLMPSRVGGRCVGIHPRCLTTNARTSAARSEQWKGT